MVIKRCLPSLLTAVLVLAIGAAGASAEGTSQAAPMAPAQTPAQPLRPVLVSQYYSDAASPSVHEAVFIDATGAVRTANAGSLLNVPTADPLALLTALSQPAGSVAMMALGEGILSRALALIEQIPAEALAVPKAAGEGQLLRYAIAYDAKGNPAPILLSAEGGGGNRRRSDEGSRALCALMSDFMPAATYFGEGAGFSYTNEDIAPLFDGDEDTPAAGDGRTQNRNASDMLQPIRSYGAETGDLLSDVAALSDGGFLLAGRASDPDDPLAQPGPWAARLDAAGDILWQTTQPTQGAFASALALTDGSVGLLLRGDAQARLLRHDAMTGEALDETPLPADTQAVFAAGDALLTVQGTDASISLIDPGGVLRWQRVGFDGITVRAGTLSDGSLYLGGFTPQEDGHTPVIICLDAGGNTEWMHEPESMRHGIIADLQPVPGGGGVYALMHDAKSLDTVTGGETRIMRIGANGQMHWSLRLWLDDGSVTADSMAPHAEGILLSGYDFHKTPRAAMNPWLIWIAADGESAVNGLNAPATGVLVTGSDGRAQLFAHDISDAGAQLLWYRVTD